MLCAIRKDGNDDSFPIAFAVAKAETRIVAVVPYHFIRGLRRGSRRAWLGYHVGQAEGI